jgi:hypothetical protein
VQQALPCMSEAVNQHESVHGSVVVGELGSDDTPMWAYRWGRFHPSPTHSWVLILWALQNKHGPSHTDLEIKCECGN